VILIRVDRRRKYIWWLYFLKKVKLMAIHKNDHFLEHLNILFDSQGEVSDIVLHVNYVLEEDYQRFVEAVEAVEAVTAVDAIEEVFEVLAVVEVKYVAPVEVVEEDRDAGISAVAAIEEVLAVEGVAYVAHADPVAAIVGVEGVEEVPAHVVPDLRPITRVRSYFSIFDDLDPVVTKVVMNQFGKLCKKRSDECE
jgi:hypothetical protein